MDKSKDQETCNQVSWFEEHFKSMLSPMEPSIMRFQSLLVWEYPLRSAVLLVCVHGLFWFLSYSNCGVYSIMSTAIMVVYFLHTWKRKIWPEIAVLPKSPDSDEWTPVHPRLLSVPELCHHLAIFWCYLIRCANWWINLRKNRPFKFCVETCFIFTCGAVFGHFISGVTLSYVIIMSGILWPCLQYHNLLQKIYMKFEPIFMKLDYSIKVKNKWRYKGDRSSVTTNDHTEGDGKMTSSVCADNESDLEDFYPTDPLISAALAHVITDSEEEGGTPSASVPISPRLSQEPSRASSDDEYRLEDDEDEFGLSIDAMPSFDETLDHTDDELLEPSFRVPREGSSGRESSEESMRFNPAHYEDSDLDDDHTLAQDFVNPDSSIQFKQSKSGRIKRVKVTKPSSPDDFVTQTIKKAMGKALKDSVMGAFQNFAAQSNPDLLEASPDNRVTSTCSDSDEDLTMNTSDLDHTDAHEGRKISEDSASLNIEEDFEFLDEYDIDSADEKE